ncbi:MAG: hypothetical protein C4291_04670 [Candidatus Dadabacteria bacterium]
MRISIALTVLPIFLMDCYTGGLFTGKDQLLKETSSTYYNMLMWKYYDRASVFVDADKREKFEKFIMETKDNLNITSYELREVVFDPDGKKGLVRVAINYYKYPSVSEKTVLLEDPWILKGGKWYVYSDFNYGIFR